MAVVGAFVNTGTTFARHSEIVGGAEGGFHTYTGVGQDFFDHSEVPSETLPFGGLRLEWAPRRLSHPFAAPLFAFGVRRDRGSREVSGNVAEFIGGTHNHTFLVGGYTVGLAVGIRFNFLDHAGR